MTTHGLRVVGALLALNMLACSSEGEAPRGPDSSAINSEATGEDPLSNAGTNAAGATSGPVSGGGPLEGFSPPPQGGEGVDTPVTFDPTAEPFIRDDTASSGLPADKIEQLRQGGGACNAPLLYPYDGTVFPGGLPSPPFMWQGETTATYVHVRYREKDSVDYQFAAGPSSPGEVTLPQDAWNEITRRTDNAAMTVTISAEIQGAVSTCEVNLQVAQGNLTGAIYYNTYNAPGVAVPGNGAVMRLTLGQTQSEIYLQYPVAAPATGPCTACHSVSFDGSTLVASTHSYVPLAQVFDVFSYPVTPALQPDPQTSLPNANFGALTPDGSRMLATGNPDCTGGADSFPRSPNNFPLVEGPDEARMLDVATGAVVEAPGLNPEWYMWMPQFSPAGDKVVFNHAKPDGAGGTDRRELAVMDFDAATNTFSNLRVVVSNVGPAPSQPYQPLPASAVPFPIPNPQGCTNSDTSMVGALQAGVCDEPCYPAFPFFTPDGKAVIFSMINQPDFSSAFPGRTQPAKGNLWYADLESGEVLPLDNINRTIYEAEANHEYYPTVLPVAVGGHFWVVWTSRRSWGHRFTGDSVNPLANPDEDPFRKRLWAAAIKPRGMQQELNAVGDPSAPGFYLEGQSLSGNVRGFAALNPCRPSGGECTSGLDCCTGFCAIEDGQEVGVCTEEAPECSDINERCESDDDCCPPGPDQPKNYCIAGFCSFLSLD